MVIIANTHLGPPKRRTEGDEMPRFVLCLLAGVMLIGVGGCGGDSDDSGPLLYAVDSSSDSLYTVLAGSGETAVIGRLAPGDYQRFQAPTAMAVRPLDGTIFVWDNVGRAPASAEASRVLLATVDRCSGVATPLSPPDETPRLQLSAIAFGPDGRLFGFGNVATSGSPTVETLFEIRQTSGEVFPIAPLDLPVYGADFDRIGKLYGLASVSDGAKLLTIELFSGTVTELATLDRDVGVIGSLVVADGLFIGSAFDNEADAPAPRQEVFRINLGGAVTNIRSVSPAPQGMGVVPGQSCGEPPPDVVWRDVAIGSGSICALATTAVAHCWARTGEPRLPTPSGGADNARFRVLSGEGNGPMCGSALDGSTFCWGPSNMYGELGYDAPGWGDARPSTAVMLGLDFAAVTSGGAFVCGLTAHGRAFCWGYNAFGQLGNGSLASSTAAVAVAGDRVFAQIDAGTYHTCALTEPGVAYCWGRNSHGQLGDGTRTDSNKPVPVSTSERFRRISVGLRHTCGVTVGGKALCWGRNAAGELGIGTISSVRCELNEECRLTPAAVWGTTTYGAIAAGGGHTCAIETTRLAFCWGLGGALGTGVPAPDQCAAGRCSRKPAKVAGSLRFAVLDSGRAETCGVTLSGAGYCWGRNLNLGDGDTTTSATPVRFGDPPSPPSG